MKRSSSIVGSLLMICFLILITTRVTGEARESISSAEENIPCSGQDCIEKAMFGKISLSSSSNSKERAATLTLRNFNRRAGGGEATKCGGKHYTRLSKVVAVAPEWFQDMEMCNNSISISISGHKKTATAKVVDECDTKGCIAASAGVWRKLGVRDIGKKKSSSKEMMVTWSDA